jgi:isopenicillin N synthase-like dioxygenase
VIRITCQHLICAGAHTDFGAITILSIPGAESGLEVKMDYNSWLKVSPKDGG